jgi:sodium-dependent phosphate cotransporter
MSSALMKTLRRIVPLVQILALLYLFLVSISLLQSAFKLFGGDFANQLMDSTSEPFLALVIGMIVTSIVQSSSVTTSLVVGLVAGGAIGLPSAIPMVMGANIGTTVTNTIVSLGQITHKQDFNRAFSAAIIHDIVNVINVIVVFPFQVYFNILGRIAESLAGLFVGIGGAEFTSPLKLIVKPTSKLIVELVQSSPWIVILIAVALLFFSLRYLVKTLKTLVVSKMQVFFDKIIFKNPLTSLLFGLAFTVMVQSSSITTSLIVPLAGAGLLNLWQVLPYTLGANIGTTITAILASLATGSPASMAVAFAHLTFNLIGTAIIWPLKFVPIGIAKFVAGIATRNRLFPILFIVFFFYVIPLLIIILKR